MMLPWPPMQCSLWPRLTPKLSLPTEQSLESEEAAGVLQAARVAAEAMRAPAAVEMAAGRSRHSRDRRCSRHNLNPARRHRRRYPRDIGTCFGRSPVEQAGERTEAAPTGARGALGAQVAALVVEMATAVASTAPIRYPSRCHPTST